MKIDLSFPLILPQNRVWRTYTGGLFLDKLAGKSDSEISHFPEDWIASTVKAINKGRENIEKEGVSFVLDDQGEKIYFDDLIEKFPYEMLGEEYIEKYGKKINILVKLLDPSIRLHLQVHPTVPFAQKYLNSNNGKTEAYYIMNTKTDASPYLLMGFKSVIDKKIWKKIIEQQNINKMLSYVNRLPVKKGDSYIVSGGVPHALGEDMLVIEIQEPTDFVVRCEFKRGDYVLPESARFMNMDMNLALDMFTYESLPKEKIRDKYQVNPKILKTLPDGSEEHVFIDKQYTDKFRMHKIFVADNFYEKSIMSYQICIVTKGHGFIKKDNKRFPIQYGDKFFVPFLADGFQYINDSDENLEIIKCLPSWD